MTPEEQDQILYKLIDQVARSQGLELVEVKVGRHQKDAFIEVLADTPKGGIGIEACTQLNRSIVEVVDKEAIFGEDGYSLEVASPGLDRPLVTTKDFLRNLDFEVHLWLKEKVAGKSEYKGIVKAAANDSVTIFTTTKDKQEIVVPLGSIMKGLLVI